MYGDGKGYLFDLDADKSEKYNLIEDHQDVAAKLLAAHNQWASEMGLANAESLALPGPGRMYFSWYLHGERIRPSQTRDNKRPENK